MCLLKRSIPDERLLFSRSTARSGRSIELDAGPTTQSHSSIHRHHCQFEQERASYAPERPETGMSGTSGVDRGDGEDTRSLVLRAPGGLSPVSLGLWSHSATFHLSSDLPARNLSRFHPRRFSTSRRRQKNLVFRSTSIGVGMDRHGVPNHHFRTFGTWANLNLYSLRLDHRRFHGAIPSLLWVKRGTCKILLSICCRC